jgi:PAS domain S-box-containing protein
MGAGIALAVLVLLAVGYAAYQSSRSVAAGAAALARGQDALAALHSAQLTLAMRPARDNETRVLLAQLRTLFAGDAVQRARLDAVETFVARQPQEIRRLFAAMELTEQQRLDARAAALQSAIRTTSRIAWGGILFTVVLVVISGMAMARELARRHAAERAMQYNEEKIRGILEAAPDAMIVTDARGRIVLANKQTERLFQYPPQELLGQPVEILVPEKVQRDHVLQRQEYGAHPVPRPMGTGLELYARRRDGTEFPAEISLSPLTLGGEVLVTAAVRDVTERNQAQRALRGYATEVHHLNAQLQQRVEELSAVNRELETFSYSVSHDLRAPLRAIDGFARILEEDHAPRLDAQAQRLIGVVRANAKRMNHLIDDLLAFSRSSRKGLEKSMVDMSRLVELVIEDLRRDGAAVPATLRIQPLPAVHGDGALLRQVWANLLSNAFKFTRTREDPCVDVGTVAGEQGPVFFVRDNGIGFDNEYADRVFGVFQRLHGPDQYEGTGVGLAIVQRIVHRHGGQVWAEAKPDEGAAFYFTLPGNGRT